MSDELPIGVRARVWSAAMDFHCGMGGHAIRILAAMSEGMWEVWYGVEEIKRQVSEAAWPGGDL